MFEFIKNSNNAMILVFIIVGLLALYLLFKKLPTKVTKKEITKDKKAEENKQEEKKTDDKPKLVLAKKKEAETKKVSEDKTKSNSKEVVQVYKSEEKLEGVKTPVEDMSKYDKEAVFVNTSKTVAKFKSFVDKKTEDAEEEILNKEPELKEILKVEPKSQKTHFDHSKRLSNIVKNDEFDDMFESHISDDYINIDSDRHLNLNKDFHNQLFSRASKTMDNSDTKFITDAPLYSNPYARDWEEEYDKHHEICEHETGDKVEINPKTLLVVDSILHRKKRKR